MDKKEIFAQLLRYFPEKNDEKIYSNMRNYSLACLSSGDFSEAEKYADIIIGQDSDKSRLLSARMVKLYTKLGVSNDTQFCHSQKFNENMPEYEELLAACSDDKVKLTKLLNLVKRNKETVAKDVRRATEAAEAERRRQEAARLEEAKRQKSIIMAREAEQRRLNEEAERRRIEKQREAKIAKQIAKQREEEERQKAIRLQMQSREKRLNVVSAIIFIALPVIGLIAIIAILASVSDAVTRNGIAMVVAFVIFILTGVGGTIGYHTDRLVLKAAYIPFGIAFLLILIIGIMSC